MSEPAKNESAGSASTGTGKNTAETAADPQWASGLKQIYDSVLDEPLPDSFTDLLDQLDAGDKE